MIKFTSFLNEASKVTVYHGNRFGTTKINPEHMDTSINEHGVGIYFTDDINTAKTYGKHVVSAKVDPSDFVESRADVSRLGRGYVDLLKYLHKVEPEGMWYLITDYGFELPNPEDVEDYHLSELAKRTSTEQIRHMQQTLVDSTSVTDFVKAWNKTIKYKGTYQRQQTGETFYMIVDPTIKLEKVF